MKFIVAADTDIGLTKETNQDSLLIKHARSGEKEILLAVICDGMGGLSKGELASATVIREFSRWFDKEIPKELPRIDMKVIGEKWAVMLRNLNAEIRQYAESKRLKMGTTATAVLLIESQYVIVHVGDTRVYQIEDEIIQLTKDHTFIKREIDKGTLTVPEAKTDKRRNLLLQCVGASLQVVPEIVTGNVEEAVLLLCSDGFRNKFTERELYTGFSWMKCKDKKSISLQLRHFIEEAKNRNEKDNISAIVIKINGKTE